jgi:hypothetical protein
MQSLAQTKCRILRSESVFGVGEENASKRAASTNRLIY